MQNTTTLARRGLGKEPSGGLSGGYGVIGKKIAWHPPLPVGVFRHQTRSYGPPKIGLFDNICPSKERKRSCLARKGSQPRGPHGRPPDSTPEDNKPHLGHDRAVKSNRGAKKPIKERSSREENYKGRSR